MSVLNVFKTSVDTINASSITSDMTIGANLNGGSLTIGNVNSVTNINSNVTNVATGGLTGSGRVNIATGANATGSEINIGINTGGTTNIRGQVNIANTGLSTNDGVNIATNGFGTNSYITMGSATFPQIYMRSVNTRINDVGGIVQIGNAGSGYTDILSNGISIGKQLSGAGYISIASESSTTTGYVLIGSANLNANSIKGKSVTINSDTNGNTIIGNTTGTGYTYIKGNNVGLGDDGGTIAIGSVSPLSGTTSTLNIRTPITIGYSPSAITSLYQIGFPVSTRADNGVSTTARLYAPINNLPNGTYITHMYFYNSVAPSPTSFIAILAYADNPITNGQSGFTGLIYDGQHEIYGTTHRAVPWTMKGGGVYVATSNTNRNIAIRAWTTDGYANETPCVIILQVTRLA